MNSEKNQWVVVKYWEWNFLRHFVDRAFQKSLKGWSESLSIQSTIWQDSEKIPEGDEQICEQLFHFSTLEMMWKTVCSGWNQRIAIESQWASERSNASYYQFFLVYFRVEFSFWGWQLCLWFLRSNSHKIDFEISQKVQSWLISPTYIIDWQ